MTDFQPKTSLLDEFGAHDTHFQWPNWPWLNQSHEWPSLNLRVSNNQSACERARRTRASERGKKASERGKEQASVGKSRLVQNGGSLGNLYISRFFCYSRRLLLSAISTEVNNFLSSEWMNVMKNILYSRQNSCFLILAAFFFSLVLVSGIAEAGVWGVNKSGVDGLNQHGPNIPAGTGVTCECKCEPPMAALDPWSLDLVRTHGLSRAGDFRVFCTQ